MKWLLFAFVGWLIWRAMRSKPPVSASRSAAPQAERMVRCAQCGLNVPEREALMVADRSYCCPAHAPQQEAAPR